MLGFWICMIILHVRQAFEESLWPRVLNKPGFWIWHGCLRKGYSEFQICLIMAPYASIKPEQASICLNVPEYAWTTVLTTPRFSICSNYHYQKKYYCNCYYVIIILVCSNFTSRRSVIIFLFSAQVRTLE